MFYADYFNNWEDQNLLKEQVLKQIKAYRDFLEAVCEIAASLESHTEPPDPDQVEIYFDTKDGENVIGVQWYTRASCSCCGDDSHYVNFPVSYLWDYHWYEKHKEKELQEQMEKAFKIADEKKKQEAKREKERFELYLSLKKEYDSVNKISNIKDLSNTIEINDGMD